MKVQEFIYYFRHENKRAGVGIVATDIKEARREMSKYIFFTSPFKYVSKEKLEK